MKYQNVLFLTIDNEGDATFKNLNTLNLYYIAFEFTQSVINEAVANEMKSANKLIECSNLMQLELVYSESIKTKNTDIQKMIEQKVQNVLETFNNTFKENSSISIFSESLEQILNINGFITVGIELNYVDRIYRDSYYNFFSNLHEDFSRKCKRLTFFEGRESCKYLIGFAKVKKEKRQETENLLNKKFIGSMVIRPLKTGAIGRTLFNPAKFLGSDNCYYIRTSQWKISFLGLELSVKAFPYLMQDGITTSCAETVLLAVMDYYSQQYNDYKFALPSAINDINMRENGTRAIPTNGLSYETMSKILCEFGFYTTFDSNFKENNLRRFLYYYIESGIPIIINMQIKDKENSSNSGTGHAALCIGHGIKNIDNLLENIEYENGLYYTNTALAYDKIYVMDDNLRPYSCYEYNDLNPDETKSDTESNCFMKRDDEKELTIDCYIVPLHKHMYMDAKRAEDIIQELLSIESQENVKQYNPATYYKDENGSNEIGSKDNPIIYRLFLASSRHLKHHRIMFNDNIFLNDLYIETPMPHFVWVCEFYTKESYSCDDPFAIGEIVIDATRCAKSSLFSSILMINYSGSVHYVRNFTNTKIFSNLSDHQDNIKQNNIILQEVKNNKFKIVPYNLNLHDKSFFE